MPRNVRAALAEWRCKVDALATSLIRQGIPPWVAARRAAQIVQEAANKKVHDGT
jgi:hypothetical protein